MIRRLLTAAAPLLVLASCGLPDASLDGTELAIEEQALLEKAVEAIEIPVELAPALGLSNPLPAGVRLLALRFDDLSMRLFVASPEGKLSAPGSESSSSQDPIPVREPPGNPSPEGAPPGSESSSSQDPIPVREPPGNPPPDTAPPAQPGTALK